MRPLPLWVSGILAIALLISFAQPSDAHIVYTAANQVIRGNDQSLSIDFNHDGVADVIIQQTLATRGCFQASVGANPGTGDAISSAYQGGGGWWADALAAGTMIGPNSPFEMQAAVMAAVRAGGPGCGEGYRFGYWENNGLHYLGVAFVEGGSVHYGWAQLGVQIYAYNGQRIVWTTLTGYAYETITGKSIVAGHTGVVP